MILHHLLIKTNINNNTFTNLKLICQCSVLTIRQIYLTSVPTKMQHVGLTGGDSENGDCDCAILVTQKYPSMNVPP